MYPLGPPAPPYIIIIICWAAAAPSPSSSGWTVMDQASASTPLTVVAPGWYSVVNVMPSISLPLIWAMSVLVFSRYSAGLRVLM